MWCRITVSEVLTLPAALKRCCLPSPSGCISMVREQILIQSRRNSPPLCAFLLQDGYGRLPDPSGCLSRPFYIGYYSSYKAMKLSDLHISLGLYVCFKNQFNNNLCLCIWLKVQTYMLKEKEMQNRHKHLLLQVTMILFTAVVLGKFTQRLSDSGNWWLVV